MQQPATSAPRADGGARLLAKLAQLTRFGLGAEDPPLLEPAEKRS